MLRRFGGAVLFAWMAIAEVMTFTDGKPSRAPIGTQIATRVAVGMLALIGLAVAIEPGRKRPPDHAISKSGSVENPPAPTPDAAPDSK